MRAKIWAWVLDAAAIIVGVVIAELILDAWHARRARWLDGADGVDGQYGRAA